MTAIAAPFANIRTAAAPAAALPVSRENRRMEEHPADNLSSPFPRAAYPSDLSDAQWERIEKLLPERKTTGRTGRPPRYSLRELLNGILYAQRTGCAWRYMPRDLPHWTSVYAYWQKWTRDGTLVTVQAALRASSGNGSGSSNGNSNGPAAAALDAESAPTPAPTTSQQPSPPLARLRRRRRVVVTTQRRSGRNTLRASGMAKPDMIVKSRGTAEPLLLRGSKGGDTGAADTGAAEDDPGTDTEPAENEIANSDSSPVSGPVGSPISSPVSNVASSHRDASGAPVS